MDPTAEVSSAVLFVSDVGRAADFYSGLFGCTASLNDAGAALLLTKGGFQIYLIRRGAEEFRATGGIGDRHLLWATDSPEALTLLKRQLEDWDAYVDTHSSGGVTFVEGRDPDGIRVIIAYPTPTREPRSVVDSRLYN